MFDQVISKTFSVAFIIFPLVLFSSERESEKKAAAEKTLPGTSFGPWRYYGNIECVML